MALEECMKLISEKLETDDESIKQYVQSVLENSIDEFSSSFDVYDAVGEIMESSTDCDESLVKDLCQAIYNILSLSGESSKDGIKKLDAPIHIANIESNADSTKETSSIWMIKADKKSVVDTKKLEKAEAKIKQKQEKKALDSQNRTNSANIGVVEASASQSVSRRDMKNENSGKNKNTDIHIENFDIAFGSKVLFESADLHISSGRRYGFVGRNGMGKTTLLKMISTRSLAIPNNISILHVEQEVEGDVTTALESVLQADIVRKQLLDEEKILQSKMNASSVTDPSLGERLAQVYTSLSNIEADKAPARAAVILNGLGFTDEMQKFCTKDLSGGWRMRLALARALFSKPDLLLLDEPTNMLDLRAIFWLEDYLKEWPTTMILVSHDRSFLTSVCTDIFHLSFRKIDLYKGDFDQFLITKEEKMKNRIKEYEAQQQYREHIQVFIDRFRYNANRASQVQSKLKLLEKLPKLAPIEKEKPTVINFPEHSGLSGTALQLDEVEFSYNQNRTIFKNVNISATYQSRICIVGENGSGKTTLLKILSNNLELIQGVRHSHRSLRIGYFTQHHVDQLDMNVTSLELISKRFPGKSQEEYRHQLGSFGITSDLALQTVTSLSGGQKSRLAFALLSMPRPNFLILDEPTNHLDMETIEALGIAINQFGGGVILVSHDERLIRQVCKELWLCGNKQVKSIEGGFDMYRKLLEEEFQRLGIK